MGRCRRGDHDHLAGGRTRENGRENDEQENKVLRSQQVEARPARLVVPLEDPAAVGERVDAVEDAEDQREGQQPDVPEPDDGPVKGHAVEVPEKQGRVSDRRQRAAHVAHDEDEEDDVVGADAGPVDP